MIDRQALQTRRDEFRALVEEHKKQVYYLAVRLTGNHHDAEDLSQEVFIKALKGMGDFRHDAAIGTWLHRITVNTYLNRTRRKGMGRTRLFGFREEAPTVVDEGITPDDAAEASLLQRQIDASLDRLTPRERSCFVLRHFDGHTVPEIAEMLSVADGTVKSLLYRAAAKMREALRPYRNEISQRNAS